MAVLVTQLIVVSGMTALSVQGAGSARALAGQPLEIVEQNGVKVLRVVGEGSAAPGNSDKGSEKGVAVAGGHPKAKVTGEPSDSAGAKISRLEGEGGGSKTTEAAKFEEPTPKPRHEGTFPAGSSQSVAVRKPASRHTLKKVTQGSVAKDLNTVIEPRVKVAVDVEAINAGHAVPGMTAEGVRTYTLNGRTYGVEAGGTLFPMTGDGFFMLNRNAYKVLGIFNKLGNTPRAHEIIELQRPSAKFTDADIESGLHAWQAGQVGGE